MWSAVQMLGRYHPMFPDHLLDMLEFSVKRDLLKFMHQFKISMCVFNLLSYRYCKNYIWSDFPDRGAIPIRIDRYFPRKNYAMRKMENLLFFNLWNPINANGLCYGCESFSIRRTGTNIRKHHEWRKSKMIRKRNRKIDLKIFEKFSYVPVEVLFSCHSQFSALKSISCSITPVLVSVRFFSDYLLLLFEKSICNKNVHRW